MARLPPFLLKLTPENATLVATCIALRIVHLTRFVLTSRSIGDKYNMIIVAEPDGKTDPATSMSDIFCSFLFVIHSSITRFSTVVLAEL